MLFATPKFAKASNLQSDPSLNLFDLNLISLVENPLLCPLSKEKTSPRENLQMLTGGGLANPQLLCYQ